MEKPYYDKESQTLQGDIVFVQDIDELEGDKIHLEISKYEILGSNGLAASLENIKLSQKTTFSESDDYEPEQSKTNPEDKKIGFILLGLGLLFVLLGIILGGLFAGMGIVIGLVFLIIAASKMVGGGSSKKSSETKEVDKKDPAKTAIAILGVVLAAILLIILAFAILIMSFF